MLLGTVSELTPSETEISSSEALFDIGRLVSELSQARRDWRGPYGRTSEPGGRDLPSRDAVSDIVDGLRAALFPMRLGPPDLRKEAEDFFVGHMLDTVLQSLLAQVRLELAWARRHDEAAFTETIDARAIRVVRAFAAGLPTIRRLLDSDVEAAFAADPAARSVDEVLICYPGVQAMILYRLAHRLHNLGVPLIARLIAELAHGQTGIDIHPGAVIGSRFFIDHGTGVVIGGTAIIGNNVQLFQAVTLGAKSFPTDGEGKALKGLPRHPIVEDDVVIYSGATVLGRVTIGRGAVIGGNVWITEDVAPYAVISQAKLLHDAELSERRHA